jgi:hypothetical protein
VTGLVGQVTVDVKYPPEPPPPPVFLPPPPPPPATTTYSTDNGEPEVFAKVPELVKV